jgi:beta-glucosidase
MTEEPLYPFGFGLSYTTFEYGSLELSPATVSAGEDVVARVTVKNAGDAAGEEVVQLYVSDLEASVTVPVASLAAFRRVYLEPGESRVVELRVPAKALELVDEAGRRVVEPGTFAVTVGGASPGDRALALGAATPAGRELAVR